MDITRPHTIAIRPACRADEPALERLAALDSARALAEPILVASVDGEVRAALSLADGRAIADPFERTAELVALLSVRATGSVRRREPRGGRVPRLALAP